MNAPTPVQLSVSEGIASIRFSRPQTLNAIDEAMAASFRDAVKDMLAHPSVRVAVLSGEGRAFMAGGDLQAFHSNLSNAGITAGRIIDPLNEAVAMLAEAPLPVLASVHGAVAGAGMSVALGADLVVAADNTRFVPAYARIGASPDGGGTWVLAQLLGVRKAMEMALLAEPFDAATALALGLVNRVVPAADLATQTLALASRLAQGPTRTWGRTKRLLRDAGSTPLRQQLRAEREAFVACTMSADFAEGLAAFFDKRDPHFIGR